MTRMVEDKMYACLSFLFSIRCGPITQVDSVYAATFHPQPTRERSLLQLDAENAQEHHPYALFMEPFVFAATSLGTLSHQQQKSLRNIDKGKLIKRKTSSKKCEAVNRSQMFVPGVYDRNAEEPEQKDGLRQPLETRAPVVCVPKNNNNKNKNNPRRALLLLLLID